MRWPSGERTGGPSKKLPRAKVVFGGGSSADWITRVGWGAASRHLEARNPASAAASTAAVHKVRSLLLRRPAGRVAGSEPPSRIH